MTNPENYDPGPGQPYGTGNRLDKDAGDGIERFDGTKDAGGTEERRPTPNASDTAEEPAESD
jgi:hypothetical protein